MHTSVASMGITDGAARGIDGVGLEKIIFDKRSGAVQKTVWWSRKKLGNIGFLSPAYKLQGQTTVKGAKPKARSKEM